MPDFEQWKSNTISAHRLYIELCEHDRQRHWYAFSPDFMGYAAFSASQVLFAITTYSLLPDACGVTLADQYGATKSIAEESLELTNFERELDSWARGGS